MSSSWPKIIRDPVHNIIPFENDDCDRLLLKLINTKEFQRLRRIKQLGVSQFVFPGADHSRFAHSIGVMHLARRMLDRFHQRDPSCVSPEQRLIVLAAALLHDVGHGPFSHAFEKITRDKHERRTLEIIRSSETEIHSVLAEHDTQLPELLDVFFDEDMDEDDRAGATVPAHLTQIVSSQLDADRFDYLLRDSAATGVEYGRFDIEWLLQHIEIDSGKRRFYLQRKARLAAEEYIFARYHMYRTVYYHKTTRAAEIMLRLLFSRYQKLLKDAGDPRARRNVVPHAPPAVLKSFTAKIPLSEYLFLDDHTFTEFAKACVHCRDPILQELAAGLLHRKLFKAIDVTEDAIHGTRAFEKKAKEIISGAGMDGDFAFARDTPSDTAYKLYEPDLEKPPTVVWIESDDGKLKELSACSDIVKALSRKYTLIRYYFPTDVRDKIASEAVPLIKD